MILQLQKETLNLAEEDKCGFYDWIALFLERFPAKQVKFVKPLIICLPLVLAKYESHRRTRAHMDYRSVCARLRVDFELGVALQVQAR